MMLFVSVGNVGVGEWGSGGVGIKFYVRGGTDFRVQAGITRDVTLVEIGGHKRITGGNGLATGTFDPAQLPRIMKAIASGGFGHAEDKKAV